MKQPTKIDLATSEHTNNPVAQELMQLRKRFDALESFFHQSPLKEKRPCSVIAGKLESLHVEIERLEQGVAKYGTSPTKDLESKVSKKNYTTERIAPVVVTTRTIRQGGFTFCGGEYQIPRRLEGEQIKAVQQGSELVGVYLMRPSQTGEKARYLFVPGCQLSRTTYEELNLDFDF